MSSCHHASIDASCIPLIHVNIIEIAIRQYKARNAELEIQLKEALQERSMAVYDAYPPYPCHVDLMS
jgi:hypothetical protein